MRVAIHSRTGLAKVRRGLARRGLAKAGADTSGKRVSRACRCGRIHGNAGLGAARRGLVRPGPAKARADNSGDRSFERLPVRSTHHKARRGMVRQGRVRRGTVGQGKGCQQRQTHSVCLSVRSAHHEVWSGDVWRGAVGHGEVRQRQGLSTDSDKGASRALVGAVSASRGAVWCGMARLGRVWLGKARGRKPIHQLNGVTSMQTATYAIRGLSPLMMHNERLANKFDDIARQISALSGQRKKTDDTLNEMARLEWLGGLYHDDTAGIHVPGWNLFAAIVAAGKLHKLGTTIKRAVFVLDDKVPLEYEGPKKPDALFKDRRFVDMRGVKVTTSRIMRCRPIFPQWALKFTATFDEGVLQRSELDRCVRDAGAMVGLCDYRPRFGRFEVVEAK